MRQRSRTRRWFNHPRVRRAAVGLAAIFAVAMLLAAELVEQAALEQAEASALHVQRDLALLRAASDLLAATREVDLHQGWYLVSGDAGRLRQRKAAADLARRRLDHLQALARNGGPAAPDTAPLAAALESSLAFSDKPLRPQDALARASAADLPATRDLDRELERFRRDMADRLERETLAFKSEQRRAAALLPLCLLLALGSGGLAVFLLMTSSRRDRRELSDTRHALRSSEADAQHKAALLTAIGASTPDLIYAKDQNLRPIYLNDAALRLTGMAQGQGGPEALRPAGATPEELAAHFANDRHVMDRALSAVFIEACTNLAGERRIYRSTKSPLLDANGRVVGVAGLSTDITEAYDSQAELARSEARFRTILNAIPAMIWTAGADGLANYVNQTFEEFVGAGGGQVALEDWRELLHPDDVPRLTRAWRASRASGAPFELEYRLRHRAGGHRWVFGRAVPLRDAEGRIQGWYGACADIQDLVESREAREEALDTVRAREAHLQSIFDAVPEAVVAIDDRGVIRSFSAAAERLFGWSADEAVGRKVQLLMPQPFRSEHDSYLERYYRTGERKIIGSKRVVAGVHKNGSTFPLELSIGEVKTERGRFFTGFMRDLSERQATERRIQEMQSELVHMARLTAMGEMASAIAHELNQPLTAITNYVTAGARMVTSGAAAPEDVQDALSSAADQALRAGTIIRRLREFVGKGDSVRRPEPVRKLLEEAVDLALVGSGDQRVRVKVDVAPDVGLVAVDKVQIQQVVLNLMRNGMEAMNGRDRRELTVRAEPSRVRGASDEAPTKIVITVADTGGGVAPHIAERLFQPFVTSKAQGLGVGLSISRNIVEAHGGTIWLERAEGGGAAFKFTLPAVQQKEVEYAL